jgi:hypothetical protein
LNAKSPLNQREIQLLVDHCRAKLDLLSLKLPDEYGYTSLPLCIIDAVFSIGVTYISTANTVNRFRAYANKRFPQTSELSVSEFAQLYEENTIEFMTNEVYNNRQRTSSVNGILKSEAALRVARALLDHNADTLSDFISLVDIDSFENAFRQIPGQRSGVSLRYLYMLTGSVDQIKPDRMILRFINAAIGRTPKLEESHHLLLEVCSLLKPDYPALDPRSLDHVIWKFQSGRT